MIVYIAASPLDARFTRICVASVRYFYPDVPIRLLAGGQVQRGLVDELQRYWGVEMSPFSSGTYGWGFVKLEPLFGPRGERFLVLDSDTALTGPILSVCTDNNSQFLVDDERQSEVDTKRLYYDWKKIREIEPNTHPPQFVFNSGQWFGTAGVLARDDFSPWVEWTMPRRLRYREHFMPGEQGILNYVVNEQWRAGKITVARIPLMRWAGHGMQGLDAEAISSQSCPSLVVHWAGMKRARHRDMVGADLLTYFENAYYKPLPAGAARRIVAGSQHAFSEWVHGIQLRARQASRRIISAGLPNSVRL